MKMKMQIVICKKVSPLALGAEIIEAIDGPGSHAAVIIESEGIAIVYEAKFPRSRKISFKEWSKHYQVIDCLTVEVPDRLAKPLMAELESMTGVWYGVPQLVMIFMARFSSFFNKVFFDDVINGKSQLICTEICFRIIRKFMRHSSSESLDMVGISDLRCELEFIRKLGEQNASIWLY